MTRLLRLVAVALLAAAAAILPATAVAAAEGGGSVSAQAGTSANGNGTFLVDGVEAFPISLTLPPPLGGTTPAGADALDEVVNAGVTFLRAGASGAPWTDATIAETQDWDDAAAARGINTWVNLRELGKAQPGSADDAMLQKVVTTLRGDIGLGLWKGVDEPWWTGVPPTAIQYAYCETTSRGDPSWCDQSQSLDPDHFWVTIQAPKGTAADLQPYSSVTDSHGVDIYPVGIKVADPDLHQVGVWTQTLASITPNHVVWTTLQICHSGSYDGAGNFVLPTALQERYMVYDAIINGARALNFYGGRNTNCFSGTDATYGWNWTFWNSVLKNLVGEIGPKSQLYPVLVSPETAIPATSSDPTTQVVARQISPTEIWVVAARSGADTASVTIGGLPGWVKTGTVYKENRKVTAKRGSFTDSFARWAVHVYRFRK